MTKTEIGTVIAIIVAVAGGALWIGQLSGRMDSIEKLDPQRAAQEAIEKAAQLVKLADQKREELKRISNEAPELSLKQRQYEYKFRKNQTKKDALMRDADVCFFTQIGGAFAGAGEFVEIYKRNNRWYFEGRNGGPAGAHAIKVEVTCIQFNITRPK